MHLKSTENKNLWESYAGKKRTTEEDENELSIVDTETDEMGVDDGLDGAEGIVMEIDPVGPVDSETDEVNEVVISELKKLAEYGGRLYDMGRNAEFDDWMVSAITIASTYVSDVWHRLDAKADFANTGVEQADEYQDFE